MPQPPQRATCPGALHPQPSGSLPPHASSHAQASGGDVRANSSLPEPRCRGTDATGSSFPPFANCRGISARRTGRPPRCFVPPFRSAPRQLLCHVCPTVRVGLLFTDASGVSTLAEMLPPRADRTCSTSARPRRRDMSLRCYWLRLQRAGSLPCSRPPAPRRYYGTDRRGRPRRGTGPWGSPAAGSAGDAGHIPTFPNFSGPATSPTRPGLRRWRWRWCCRCRCYCSYSPWKTWSRIKTERQEDFGYVSNPKWRCETGGNRRCCRGLVADVRRRTTVRAGALLLPFICG